MNYDLTTPCPDCPFLKKNARHYARARLKAFAGGEFACHNTAEIVETSEGCEEFHANEHSQHCAGVLIYLEKRNRSHQMMRITERFGSYDRTKLKMDADVI